MRSWYRRGLVAAFGFCAAMAFTPPIPAHAAGKTVVIWWNQGFYQAEDQAMKDAVAAWEKATGDKVQLTFTNGSDLPAKVVAAITTGEVPDVIYADVGDFVLIPQNAWNGKLVDVSDVVDTQKSEYNKAALEAGRYYNNVTHKRSYYGVPLKEQALHVEVWKPLVEEAGYKMSDIPKQWDQYFDFFEDVQKKLRAKGKRIYGLGYSLATKDSDSTYLFNQFLVAYGGGGIVTPDGKLHADDPKVREAAIKALDKLTKPYKEGFVPPGAINWGDPDNNNAFYARQIVMTPNATISIAVAQMEKTDQYMHEIVTQQLPLGPDGKPVTSLVAVKQAFIPKGAKNVEGAKDFLKAFIQPKNLDNYLKQARGRWTPVMPSIVKDDPYWLDPKDPHRHVSVSQQVGENVPIMPWFMSFNPAYADVNAEQIWGKAEANVMTGGMTPEKAVDIALTQIKADFAKYPEPTE